MEHCSGSILINYINRWSGGATNKGKAPKSVHTVTQLSEWSIRTLFLMNTCTSAFWMPKAWAVKIESVPRNPLLSQCTFRRTSLLSWVRGDSYEGDRKPHQKAVKWNCQALKGSHSTWKKISLLDIFYRFSVSFIIPLSLHPLSPTRTRCLHIRMCTGTRARS